jgi:hypothetical protein
MSIEDHPMRRRSFRQLLALVVLAVPSSSARADHPTPYKGRFDFTTVSVVPVSDTVLYVRGSLTGNETQLGRFTGEVEYLVDVTTLKFEGKLTKTAANGDLLKENLTGQFTLDDQFTPTGSVGEFTITGGTGRFRGATGSGTFEGIWTDPDLITAHITFDGSISTDGGKGH